MADQRWAVRATAWACARRPDFGPHAHALELRHLTPGKISAVPAAMGLRPETLEAVVATNCGSQEWDSDWLPGPASLRLLAPPSSEPHNRHYVLLDVAPAAGLTRHDPRDVL